jgi:hypothetical protein
MLRHSAPLCLAASLLLAAGTDGIRAAIPITPELEQLSEGDRVRKMNYDAEVSLREKIQVGAQRYEVRQAYRRSLVEGLRARVETRQSEIIGNNPVNPNQDKKTGLDATGIILAVLLAIGGFFAIRFLKHRQPGSADVISS